MTKKVGERRQLQLRNTAAAKVSPVKNRAHEVQIKLYNYLANALKEPIRKKSKSIVP
jgi:hypothetical protein